MRSRSSTARALVSSPGREPLDQGQQQHGVSKVGLDRLSDPGILDLHDHVVAVDGPRAMDLPDRGRGEGLLLEVREHPPERPTELLAHQLLELSEGHRRDVVAERAELALQLVLLFRAEAVELDQREHLADLHRRAPHLPELIDQLLDQRSGALVLGGGGPVGRAHAVGGTHPGPAQPLARHQATDAGRPGQPPTGQLPGLGRRILGVGTHAPSLASRPRSAGGAYLRRKALIRTSYCWASRE